MIQTVTCRNCGRYWVHGLDNPLGTGPDDPLPGDIDADTCYVCRPDLGEEGT